MEVALSVSGLLTAVVIGLGKWYFNQLNARIKNNEDMIQKLEKEVAKNKAELELNQQADNIYRESVTKDMKEIKDGNQKILDTFNDFLTDYGFVIKKWAAKEMGGS